MSRRLLVIALAIGVASCGRNHAPVVTVLEAPTSIQRDGFAALAFKVDDRDGDSLTVRLRAANPGEGWFVATNDWWKDGSVVLAPGTVSRVWYRAIDAGQVTIFIDAYDGVEATTTTLALRVE